MKGVWAVGSQHLTSLPEQPYGPGRGFRGADDSPALQMGGGSLQCEGFPGTHLMLAWPFST